MVLADDCCRCRYETVADKEEKPVTTILLVNEDADELYSQRTLLRRLGYDVIAESAGRSALARIGPGAEVGAVITESRLTDMETGDFFKELRRHAPSAPVIVLTRHGTVENYLECLNLGVYEYAISPVRPRELERILAAALRAEGVHEGMQRNEEESRSMISALEQDREARRSRSETDSPETERP